MSLRETLSNWTSFTLINKNGKGAVIQTETVLQPIYHVACQKGPLKQDVLENYLTTYFGVCNFENTSAMNVIFFRKCSKFNANFKSAQKSWENVCCFWYKCIWVGWVKLCLLRREYLSSAVNLWTNSLKILLIPKRDFFQLNYLHSDQ